jgi:hypothetical protein
MANRILFAKLVEVGVADVKILIELLEESTTRVHLDLAIHK